METTYKINIVDDNLTFLRDIELFLKIRLNCQVTGTYHTGEEAVANITPSLNTDIVLMDINLPGINGIVAAKRILENNRNLKIIAITQETSSIYIKSLIESGIKGILLKKDLFRELSLAIDEVMNGEYHFPVENSNYNKILKI